MNWLSRLKQGLERPSHKLGQGLGSLFTGKKKCDQALLDNLEEILLEADLGPHVTGKLLRQLAEQKFDKEIDSEEVKTFFADLMAEQLQPITATFPDKQSQAGMPTVILVVGVNGVGKTTSIGKLAHHLQQAGHKVMLAAGDTYRAAAVEQLSIWGQRNHVKVIKAKPNGDAAALAFDAIEAAMAEKIDFLLMDTAGRLHNRDDLMQELAKIKRVMAKKLDGAPHHSILILDATTGQNALAQIAAFNDITDLTGLIMTKLDGTAKGGILLAIAERFSLPIHAIGVGEGIEDLQPFDAKTFTKLLLNIP